MPSRSYERNINSYITEKFHFKAVFYYVMLDRRIVSAYRASKSLSIYISCIYTAQSGQAPPLEGVKTRQI
jgi:hypothetical protein